MKITNLIVDTDPGVDDSVALFFISQAKNVKTRLIVASAGNTDVNKTAQNAKYLAKRFKIDAPIVLGSKNPIKPFMEEAKDVHGKNGLGGFEFKREVETFDDNYCEKIKEILDNFENVSYLSLAPLTNLANFITKYPQYKSKIKEIVFVGGVKDKVVLGKVYPSFNIGFDPMAAEIIISSGIKLVMIPSNLGHLAYFSPEDINRISLINQLGIDFKKMFNQYFDREVPKDCVANHDAVATLYYINSKLLKLISANAKVKYFDEVKTGCIVNDITTNKKTNIKMAVDVNVDKFKELFFNFLKKFKE